MVKDLPANGGDAGDMGSIPGLRGSPGEGTTTHSSTLAWEIPWTKESGQAAVHGAAKSWTQLSA